MGVPNWIYVKMHNGGAADNGTLDIYYAQASVSLSWPAAWTMLASVPLTVNSASTRIVEIPWNSLPGEGHYCMIARWSSTADPVSPETADIGNNTRQNNNIVWRNLNIVPMEPDADRIETFYMQSSERGGINLKFTDESIFPSPAFTQNGRVFVRLNDTVYAAWKKGGSKGSGIKQADKEIEITAANASVENIMLETKGMLKNTIRFSMKPSATPGRYNFTLQQTNASGNSMGGISYEIFNYKK